MNGIELKIVSKENPNTLLQYDETVDKTKAYFHIEILRISDSSVNRAGSFDTLIINAKFISTEGYEWHSVQPILSFKDKPFKRALPADSFPSKTTIEFDCNGCKTKFYEGDIIEIELINEATTNTSSFAFVFKNKEWIAKKEDSE